MSHESIYKGAEDRAQRLSPAAGAAITISFLLGSYYWSSLFYFDFSPVCFRLIFLASMILLLRFRLAIPVEQMIGRIGAPESRHWRFLAASLAIVVGVRLALKLIVESFHPGLDSESLTIANVVYECVIPPLNEEPVFRGMLLTALCAIFTRRISLVILFASLIFSAGHDVRNLAQQAGTFVLACITCAVALRTRSLSSCMALHAVYNAMVFLPPVAGP